MVDLTGGWEEGGDALQVDYEDRYYSFWLSMLYMICSHPSFPSSYIAAHTTFLSMLFHR